MFNKTYPMKVLVIAIIIFSANIKSYVLKKSGLCS